MSPKPKYRTGWPTAGEGRAGEGPRGYGGCWPRACRVAGGEKCSGPASFHWSWTFYQEPAFFSGCFLKENRYLGLAATRDRCPDHSWLLWNKVRE